MKKKIFLMLLFLLVMMGAYYYNQIANVDSPRQRDSESGTLAFDNSGNTTVSGFSSSGPVLVPTNPSDTVISSEENSGRSELEDASMPDQEGKDTQPFLDEGDHYLVRRQKFSIRRDPHRMTVKS